MMRHYVIASLITVLAVATAAAQHFQLTLQNPPSWTYQGAFIDLNFSNGSYWYSGRTTGNSGLLTTTRASVGYAQNVGGLLQLFPTGIPRITDKGLLIEEIRTNSAIQSRDMTNVAWTASNMTVAATAVGADGTANTGMTLTSTNANATVLQSITLGSAAYTYSVWLRRVTGTGNVDITADNGTTWTTQTLTTSYQQFQVSKTAANPIIGIRLVTSGDVVEADFNQLEAGSFATSPIVTTTIAVARAADVITLSSIIGLTQGTPFSIMVAYNIPQVNGLINWRLVEGTDGTVFFNLRNNGGSVMCNNLTTGTVNAAGTTTIGKHKLAGRMTLNNINVAIDGTYSVLYTGGSADLTPVTRIDLGNSQAASPRQMNGYMERLTIWTYGLSDSNLAAVTKL